MDYVQANDTCIQCHSQGRPLANPIEGNYYDWPVGYHVGRNLAEYWQLEEHTLGETTFTHFPDGTAHKNRMQGNDFVQSVMYRRGVTCSTCHDVHGTDKPCTVAHARQRRSAWTVTARVYRMARARRRSKLTPTTRPARREVNASTATCRRSRRQSLRSRCARILLRSSPRR